MVKDLIMKNRSYRRFHENEPVSVDDLKELLELARCSGSGGNVQPIKFMLSCDPETNGKIFPHLAWAGGLPDWNGPEEGERPAAYIIILGDTDISSGFGVNHGIAAQSILLGAVEKGLGGCMLGSIKRERVREELAIPERFEILLIIALGKPAEEICIEPVGKNGNIQYWHDQNGVHHVPKRDIEEIIIGRY